MAKDKTTKAKKSRPDDEDDEHGVKDISSQLDALDDGWEDTEEKALGDVPDGAYQCQITSIKINNAKSSGRLQASWELTILNTEHRGRKVFFHNGIEDEEQRGYLRGALAKLGVEWPKKSSDLPDVLAELEGTFCEMKGRTKKKKDKETGEFSDQQNWYVNRALDSDDLAEAPMDDEDEEEEEKPKKKKGKKEEPEDEDEEDEDEDEEEAKPKKRSKAEPEEKEVEAVNIKFKDEDLLPKHKRVITELAEKNDLDPDDYDHVVDLAADVAEYFGLSGDYSKPKTLILALEEASAKKSEKD